MFGTISDSVRLRTCLVYCRTFGRTPKSASTAVAEHGTSAGYQRVRRNGLQTNSAVTSAVLLGLVFRCQWGKHEGFVNYFFRLRSNGKEKRVIFFNFRQPPNTLHIHSSDRERTWPEAHCHVCDCRAFSTMSERPPFWVITETESGAHAYMSVYESLCLRSPISAALRDPAARVPPDSTDFPSPSAQGPNCHFTLPPTVNKQTTFSIDRESYSDAIFTCWQVWSAAVWEKREGSFEPRGRRSSCRGNRKTTAGNRKKQQEMECLWNFFYVFLLSMIECMSIDLQRTWLGGFGQKLIQVFSLPSQCRQCQTSTLWGGLKLCAQMCRVV